MTESAVAANIGKIVEIKGVVMDVVFPDTLPAIYNALRITVPGGVGRPEIDLVAEVQQHLGDDTVRAVAMDSTDGIPRGCGRAGYGRADHRSGRSVDARPSVQRPR